MDMNVKVGISGADEVIEKMNEIDAHLNQVKNLIYELNNMDIKLKFSQDEPLEDS